MTTTREDDGVAVLALYHAQLVAWNARDAAAMAALYAEDGSVVGFDGSPVDGRAAIAAHLGPIFADHPIAAYVGKIREVRFLAPDVALVRAVAGLVPPGKSEINPDLNAVQALVAIKRDGRWEIALYQNTPAAFHGRPDASRDLTAELQWELDARSSA